MNFNIFTIASLFVTAQAICGHRTFPFGHFSPRTKCSIFKLGATDEIGNSVLKKHLQSLYEKLCQ